MNKEKYLDKTRLRRRRHVRNKTRGTADRPRLSVTRSLKNISCQLIDDESGKTITAASSLEKQFAGKPGGNAEAAAAVGKALAERALEAGVKQAKFDRGHSKYHGRVAALADAAREAGLSL